MDLEVLARQHGGLAAVRAGDGEAAALGVMRREGVENELLGAVAAGHQPLGALAELVLAQVATLHLHAALVLAVEGLVAAGTHVLLQIERASIEYREKDSAVRSSMRGCTNASLPRGCNR